MSYLNRMGLARRMLMAALGIGLFASYMAGAWAKVDDCYIGSRFSNDYKSGKSITKNVTGVFDNITGAPDSDVPLGMQTINVFDRDSDLECANKSGSNSVTVNGGATSIYPESVVGTDPSGRTLYLVNAMMPGIAYSMEIVCQGADASGQCQGHSGDTIPVVYGSTNGWPDQDGHPWDQMNAVGNNQSGMNFKINLYFWQLPTWQPFPYDGVIAGGSHQLFSLKVGAGIEIPYKFEIYLQPKTPTCDTHISVKGNASAVINLGEGITPQQLSGDSADKVPFTLVVDNCSATLNNVYVKMTTTTVDGSNATLLGQQSGSAAGVGVKITDDQDNPLSPDGASTLTFPYVGVINHRELNMKAQLVNDGTPVQPGDFQASATFTISYD